MYHHPMRLSTAVFTAFAAYATHYLLKDPQRVRRRRTPGVYKLVGKNGRIWYGQSSDIEKRAPVSARENTQCLGRNPQIKVLLREPSMKKRLEIERNLIKRHRARAPDQVCNLVDW